MSVSFVSTRGGGAPVSFDAALLRGLAPDGGLYVPTRSRRSPTAGTRLDPFAAVAARVLAPWLARRSTRG